MDNEDKEYGERLDWVQAARKLGAHNVADALASLEHDPDSKTALAQIFRKARILQYALDERFDQPTTKAVIVGMEKKVFLYPHLARIVSDEFADHVEIRSRRSYGKDEAYEQTYGEVAQMMRGMLARHTAHETLKDLLKVR